METKKRKTVSKQKAEKGSGYGVTGDHFRGNDSGI